MNPVAMRVAMSDGVEIAVDHYPVGGGPAPAALAFVPYRKESAGVALFAQVLNGAGFHFLVADVRGFGGSVARYEGLLSEREVEDGVEAIGWLAAQSFCDGKVAMVGGSYFGANQVLIASRRPAALRCIAPFVNFVDTYRDMTHRGGIPSHGQWGAMTYLRSQHPATARAGLEQWYLDLMLDPLDNEGHRARSPESVLDRVAVPTLCLGGWHDYFLRGTVRTFLGVRGPKRLVIGPWGHGGLGPDHQAELLGWLRYWLRGEGEDPSDPSSGARVRLYETGTEAWRTCAAWPDLAAREWVGWHPVVDGSLGPSPGDGPVAVRIVPHLEAVAPAGNPKPQSVPDPTDSGMGHWGEDAVFVSEAFERHTVLDGPVSFACALEVDGQGDVSDGGVSDVDVSDVDVHVRLSVMRAADGAGVVQVAEGRLRASHRALDLARSTLGPDGSVVVPWHRHEREERLSPGRPVDLVVELAPVCHRVAAGERLVLGITVARADEGAAWGTARLGPSTRLLVPVRPVLPA
jgi:predicted acyl esterase